MCISNELCTEIAVALLATRENSKLDLAELKEIVMEVHAALQKMEQNQRRTRRRRKQDL
jgi:hypothetical protein